MRSPDDWRSTGMNHERTAKLRYRKAGVRAVNTPTLHSPTFFDKWAAANMATAGATGK